MSNYYEGIPFGSKIGRGRRRGRSPLLLIAALVVAFGILYLLTQQASWLWADDGDGPLAVPSPTVPVAVVVEATQVPAPALPTLAPPPTPRPSPTATPTPPPPPAVLQVANTGGLGVYMRRSPSSDERMRAWMEGTKMTVVGPEEVVGGNTWQHVQDPQGNEGWVPARYLVPAPPEPEAPPAPAAG